MKQKKNYVPPLVEVTRVMLEGTIALSLVNQPGVRLHDWDEMDPALGDKSDIWIDFN